MANIKPITFPGNIGIANEIKIRVIFDIEDITAKITYQLLESSTKKIVSHNSLTMPEDIFAQWGADNQYVINWLAQQLGLELI